VRQGGIISPVLCWIYIDGLLCMLCESGVGCYIGHVFVGALAYADDIALLAPTPSAMRRFFYGFVMNMARNSLLCLMQQNLRGFLYPKVNSHSSVCQIFTLVISV